MEQRKSYRFELRLPVQLVRHNHTLLSEQGETKNVSSSGVLCRFGTNFNIGDRIEYLITLSPPASFVTVRIRCRGRIVRLTNGPEVAVTVERHQFERAARASESGRDVFLRTEPIMFPQIAFKSVRK
jgi:hypothetical protein